MRNVVAPQVQLVTDPLGGEHTGEPPGAVQRSGGVLPLALTADQQQVQPAAQPVQVLTVHVRDVIHRVVEVRLITPLTPGMPGRGVVVTGKTHRAREQVGALEREVSRVKSAETVAERDDVQRPAAVVVDPRHHLVENPPLVEPVAAGPFLHRDRLVGPGFVVEAVHAVHLQPTRLQQIRDRGADAVLCEVGCPALLGGKDQYRATPVPVAEAIHWQACRSKPARYGSKALCQDVQSCPPGTSCKVAG